MQYIAPARVSTLANIHSVTPSRPFSAAADSKYVGLGEREHPYLANGNIVRSVAEMAGLDGYVYFHGGSGKRYVFSKISLAQASLYDRALFAVCDMAAPSNSAGRGAGKGTGSVRFVNCCSDLPAHCGQLYVHLLDDDAVIAERAVADLTSQELQ